MLVIAAARAYPCIPDSPIEIIVGSTFLYKLLGESQLTSECPLSLINLSTGVSSFFGLAVTCIFLPLNHYAGKVVVGTLVSYISHSSRCDEMALGAQDNLMKARDERTALMNEVRMILQSSGTFSLTSSCC